MNVIVIDFQNKIIKIKFIKNIVSTNLKHNLNKILSSLDEILYRQHNTYPICGNMTTFTIQSCNLYLYSEHKQKIYVIDITNFNIKFKKDKFL